MATTTQPPPIPAPPIPAPPIPALTIPALTIPAHQIPAVVGHEPHNPVRNDAKLAPTEDLDREPDGVPHSIVGLTALFSVMLAMLVAFMFIAGGTATRVAAVLLTLMAIPVLVGMLRKKSERDRDHVHPSR